MNKKAKSRASEIANELTTHIEHETRDLSDEEYVAALEEISSFCDSAIAAKTEELVRGPRKGS